ncbi:uncharacterized protein TNCV_3376861 [Trichonephila clavipes]|nr:uncharacterized protein TNCV_3376861 [Trichonephila clavipes]
MRSFGLATPALERGEGEAPLRSKLGTLLLLLLVQGQTTAFRVAGGNVPPFLFRGVYIVATVAEWYRYWIMACLVTSSSPVPLKTRRVGKRCTLNLSRAETSFHWCGVVVRRGVPAQVSSTSLDHGSK